MCAQCTCGGDGRVGGAGGLAWEVVPGALASCPPTHQPIDLLTYPLLTHPPIHYSPTHLDPCMHSYPPTHLSTSHLPTYTSLPLPPTSPTNLYVMSCSTGMEATLMPASGQSCSRRPHTCSHTATRRPQARWGALQLATMTLNSSYSQLPSGLLTCSSAAVSKLGFPLLQPSLSP